MMDPFPQPVATYSADSLHGMPSKQTVLINARSRQTIATKIELAITRAARRRGLLKRTGLDPAGALVLAPCMAVHTAFMQFAIDIIFIDRQGCVRRIVRGLPPWRMVASPRAWATIELAAGALDSCDLEVGDALYLDAPPELEGDIPACLSFNDTRRAIRTPRAVGLAGRETSPLRL